MASSPCRRQRFQSLLDMLQANNKRSHHSKQQGSRGRETIDFDFLNLTEPRTSFTYALVISLIVDSVNPMPMK